MEPRYYQKDAVKAVYAALEGGGNPCVVVPTGGGKTIIIAQLCHDVAIRWGGRVLVLAHVKELLEQASEKLLDIFPEMLMQIGVYSASLKSRDTGQAVIIAGIQSAYKRACDLGTFDLIIVDEAHLIPPSGEGMYRKFLADMKIINPKTRMVGMTATPFRMKGGAICAPENILQKICYEISVAELIEKGFLSNLVSQAAAGKAETDDLHVRAGEFLADEVATIMDNKRMVETACAEVVRETRERRSVLIFACSIEHGGHVAQAIRDAGHDCGEVYGDTPMLTRGAVLDDFKHGDLKYIVNVAVLTTGFDAPGIDCVVLLRPTASAGLYYQMVGRGFRVAPKKENCLVLDFGNNILRHGPVDAIVVPEKPKRKRKGEAVMKECPECRLVMPAGVLECERCGHEFPRREAEHEQKAAQHAVLSAQQESFEPCIVQCVRYYEHVKKGHDDAPHTMRVEYSLGISNIVSEWICVEHERGSFAHRKASQWWQQRCLQDMPSTAAEAVSMARAGLLTETKEITVRRKQGERFPRISGYSLGNISTNAPLGDDNFDDDLPF